MKLRLVAHITAASSRKMTKKYRRARKKPFAKTRKALDTPRHSFWRRWGKAAGLKDAKAHPIDSQTYQRKALNTLWEKRIHSLGASKLTPQRYEEAAKGYVKGYGKATGIHCQSWMLLPTNRSVAVIVSLMNEEVMVSRLLEQLQRLPLDEIILVINGSSDSTFTKARQLSDTLIVYFDHPIGHDIGRAIGAKMSNSDILLFVDGDFFVSAEQLVPFISAVDQGADLALNDITPFLKEFAKRDAVTVMKEFLNISLGRPDLGANSMTAVPHAISRKAYETIGYSNLVVPPKAQAFAIQQGLRISMPTAIDVLSKNKRRSGNTGERNPVAQMIIGDHVEALKLAMEYQGKRLQYPDTWRKREYAGGEKHAVH